MKAVFFVVLALLAALFLAGVPGGLAETSATLALMHVTVIDPSGRPAQADQTVIVSDGRVTAIGASGTLRVPKGARVIDARGKFLIPGLWDMHTNIAGISANPSWARQVLIPLLVASGITGIRDMGGDLDALKDWRRQIASGAVSAAVSSAVSSTMTSKM